MSKKYVYSFDEVKDANTEEMAFILGNKGSQLAEMTAIGLPVPPGFTITTEACKEFYSFGKKWPKGLDSEVKIQLARLEKRIGKKLGDSKNPLFVSVRSGSYVSMPGMMDTILNLGMNDKSVLAFAAKTGNKRAAWDSYRRFINMFGDVVMGVEHSRFEKVLSKKKETRGVKFDTELSAQDLEEVTGEYKKVVREEKGIDFPQDPSEQLRMAIDAVFNSWNCPRAIAYRRINKLRDDAGTGVNVQAMVFGNMGNDSGTGVAFTRNPANGNKEHYGEFLINAQGEDVVSGIRTPEPIDALKKYMPIVYADLLKVYERLEKHYKEMQDFEFTIEGKKLYLLQTRKGKRTVHAAVKIAVDMENEGFITKEEAVLRVEPNQLNQLLHKQLDPIAKKERARIARGLAASPGAAVGKVVLTAEKAKRLVEENPLERVVLVRTETSPEDIEGMHASQGFLTARGGITCIAGNTLLMTNKGFITAEELFKEIEQGSNPKMLSFDSKAMKTKWKSIIAAGKKEADAIEINVSQSGRTKNNSLIMTGDHKMMVIENRKLIKKPLENVLADNNLVSIVDRVPYCGTAVSDPNFAYLAGAILTDGCIQLSNRRGRVIFTQKGTNEKFDFIRKVNLCFFERYGLAMRETIKRSLGTINGRMVSGEAFDYYCSRKLPAAELLAIKEDVAQFVMSLDEQSTLSFLAGAIDGDGTFCNSRIQIYVGNKELLQGIVAACLKLGVVPQVTENRGIKNVQIVEKINEILMFTERVKTKGKIEKKYDSKLFSVKQLFEDVKNKVDFTGKIKPAIRDNKMLSDRKIREYVFYPALGETIKKEAEKIINSEIRMYRCRKTGDYGKTTVYNFEVDSENELDKNFVAFTSKYSPILVSNSHAAVVARGMGKPCVAGCEDIVVHEKEGWFEVPSKGIRIKEGEKISIDGGTGEIYEGEMPLSDPQLKGEFGKLMSWADSFRKLGVRTNADTPHDAEVARSFGAEGIGLCRTEHMFFEGERIKAMREMILSTTEDGRRCALAKLLPFQKKDFIGLFKAMNGLDVTIRLLDPPLHEFLPKEEKDIQALADEMGLHVEKIREISESLHEFNPMLGFRGCRLAIVYPEIAEMQVQAIIEAAIESKRAGVKAKPEIMVPVLGHATEMIVMKEIIDRIAKETMAKAGEKNMDYKVGVMMELPRACITADEIAKHAEFFSFGTNDLTQTTFGYSRDDAGKFIKHYLDRKILTEDPFETIDQDGVGELIKMSIEKGRKTKPNLKIGLCGEQGGEGKSVEFCHTAGLNYVSCSPFRIPIARLAAAHAALKEKKVKTESRPSVAKEKRKPAAKKSSLNAAYRKMDKGTIDGKRRN